MDVYLLHAHMQSKTGKRTSRCHMRQPAKQPFDQPAITIPADNQTKQKKNFC